MYFPVGVSSVGVIKIQKNLTNHMLQALVTGCDRVSHDADKPLLS